MNKYELSILIPARNEMFLAKTIENILRNKRGNTEVLVALDGEWSNPGIPSHKDLTIVYFSEAKGQRAATNALCRMSQAKYVMKLDAHCELSVGFDIELMAAMKDNYTIAPLMRNLHAFDWCCIGKNSRTGNKYLEKGDPLFSSGCGYRFYQGPTPESCKECGGQMERELMWIAKESPKSTSFCFDPTPHFQYFMEYRKRPEGKGDFTETMSLQGSCFMLTRKKYWELNICDEEFGSWGSQGIEVAVKTWLSGGRVMCVQNAWYAHLFRTQGKDFGFPYPQSGRQVEHAKHLAKDLFFTNSWDKQIYPLSCLLERFWPVPGWTDEDLAGIKKFDSAIPNFSPEKFGVFSVVPIVPSSVTDHTAPMSSDSNRQEVAVPTVGLPSLPGSSTNASQDILGVGNKSEMGGVATGSVVTDVIQDGDGPSLSVRDGSNEPSVHESVSGVELLVDPDLSIPHLSESSPIPTITNGVNSDLRKDTINGFRRNIINGEHGDVHNTTIQQTPLKVNSRNIIFYTDNKLNTKIAHKVQDQLRKIGLPIVSASLKPMPHFGDNIHLPLQRGIDTYFQQIIAALEKSTAEIVYMCEHDVLYHPSHFDFIPPTKDKFYYNQNFWRIRPGVDNLAVHWDANQVSGLVCYREHLLKWYRNKYEEMKKNGFDRSYEPGGRDTNQYEVFKSAYPNIDIRHDKNLTKSKWSLADFRDKSTATGWMESTSENIPGWNPPLVLI